MKEAYDSIIIGAGPAGMQASVFLSRAGLKNIIIGDCWKSHLSQGMDIGNYLGLNHKSGNQILKICKEQVESYNGKFLKREVIDIKKINKIFNIKTDDNRLLKSKTIIIATGLSYKKSGIKNEEKFIGRGVHYCVACDGYFYKNKKVAVIGNGNYAAEEAIELLSYSRDVSIISNGRKFEFSDEIKKILEKNKIKLLKNDIKSFEGKNKLENLTSGSGNMQFDGVFIAIGAASALNFADKLGIEKKEDYLVVGRDMKTSVDGIYAAGGCTGGAYQMAKSVGEGCVAAISITKKLKGMKKYTDLT